MWKHDNNLFESRCSKTDAAVIDCVFFYSKIFSFLMKNWLQKTTAAAPSRKSASRFIIEIIMLLNHCSINLLSSFLPSPRNFMAACVKNRIEVIISSKRICLMFILSY